MQQYNDAEVKAFQTFTGPGLYKVLTLALCSPFTFAQASLLHAPEITSMRVYACIFGCTGMHLRLP